ncbi:hypothetical protein BC828DRAFT_393916 [Blastocladiella britannica]|nr:hypothetical protein BC828DRAFT_393916 [Blastocladiella britannica]
MNAQRRLVLVPLVLALTAVTSARLISNTRQPSLLVLDLERCFAQPSHLLNLSHLLPPAFEPSDAVYVDSRHSLMLVSDDGQVLELDPWREQVLSKWHVALPVPRLQLLASAFGQDTNGDSDLDTRKSKQFRADLEGCTWIPSRPEYLYLGAEYPPTILEFSLRSGIVTRYFNLAALMETSLAALEDSGGIEALAYMPDPERPEGGVFLAGRQSDGRIYAMGVPRPLPHDDLRGKGSRAGADAGNLSLRGIFDPPGPGKDLSAMVVAGRKLLTIWDKPQRIVEVDLRDSRLHMLHGPFSALERAAVTSIDLSSDDEVTIAADTPWRGIEAFAAVHDPEGKLHVFLGLDINKNRTRQLYHYFC